MSALQFLRFGGKSDYTWDVARRDLVAGVTVAAIAIPQAMAYALIAGVDPRFGLYSAFMVTIIASVFGSSSHLINGPTNAISLLVFSALVAFDERYDSYQAMFLLAIIVGVMQILIAVFKLGDLTRYVSESVILGFMAGAGVLVAMGQVGNFLGVAEKGSGDQSVLGQLWETLTKGGAFNLHAIGIGRGHYCPGLLLRRLINQYKLPQMDMLLALVTATLVAALFQLVGAGGRRQDCRRRSGQGSAGAAFVPYSGNPVRMDFEIIERCHCDCAAGPAGGACGCQIDCHLYPPAARL